MRLFIHALGASAGGGLTYLRNLLPHLAERNGVTVTVLAGKAAGETVGSSSNLQFLDPPVGSRGSLSRSWWEQREIPSLIRRSGADVLLSTGNFAVWNSPVPQILLSRNSLYTSPDFNDDLLRRAEYRLWADTKFKGWLARRSIRRAQLTLSPSESFARELRDWSGQDVQVLPHGFDREAFTREAQSLPAPVEAALQSAEGSARLLFVSHYNYYRNFETLLRAVALVKRRLTSRRLRVFLTCEFAPGKNPGSYRTETAAALIQTLHIEQEIVQLGAIPYGQLHHLYRACDAYVTPAYTETFAHPLVEAMASGLPIIASDLPVHREVTAGAALFFEKFSAEELADQIVQLLDTSSLREKLRNQGLLRAQDFSWKQHTERLLELAMSLAGRKM
jgi:glycosyltransferase involved in cell wall biosynthesis